MTITWWKELNKTNKNKIENNELRSLAWCIHVNYISFILQLKVTLVHWLEIFLEESDKVYQLVGTLTWEQWSRGCGGHIPAFPLDKVMASEIEWGSKISGVQIDRRKHFLREVCWILHGKAMKNVPLRFYKILQV